MTDPTEPPSTKRGIIAELSYRHVWRAAVVYIGAVWALVQGIAQLGPSFGMPDWVTRWFVVACAIGFPFWIAFAWFYKLTPDGLKRETDMAAADDPAFHRATGRRLDFWIIGVLAVAVVLLVTNQFVLHRDATGVANVASAKAWAATLAKVPSKSVAVLPFTSADPKQQYFSDGMAEELISDLTQVSDLKVIGSYSSFKFRGSADPPAQIGAILGVANLVEGSVDQQGGRIRVVVGMIRARDGASVWSHTYDQPIKDVFAIQAKIGKAVTAALKIKLLGNTLVNEQKPPNGNVEAYRLFLQSFTVARGQSQSEMTHGIALLKKAVQLAPNYAAAWAALSQFRLVLGLYYRNGGAQQQVFAQVRTALDHATLLAPNAWPTIEARGLLLSALDFDQAAALAEYRRGLALAPNNALAMTMLAQQLRIMGQPQAAVALLRKAIAKDPLRAGLYSSLSTLLVVTGKLDAAEQAIRKVLTLQPASHGAYEQLVTIDILRHDLAAARRDAAKASQGFKPFLLTAVQQISGDPHAADASLRAYINGYGKTQASSVADLYAIRKQPDVMFQWLQRAVVQQKSTTVLSLLSDPYLLPYQHDPRFATLCRKLGLPVPGQPLPAETASTP
ncbi:MAG TPA: tetratricopeptide repeat protein [Rhodanobacteraceae bacterium]